MLEFAEVITELASGGRGRILVGCWPIAESDARGTRGEGK
jgi:hypothetical protein